MSGFFIAPSALNGLFFIKKHLFLNIYLSFLQYSASEKRYYISSLPAQPKILSHAVRQHWGVENKLHWVLDICFNDDQSRIRIRKGNAPRNIAIVKKTVLNLLQVIKKTKPRISLKAMRKLAGWDQGFLDTVLMAKF